MFVTNGKPRLWRSFAVCKASSRVALVTFTIPAGSRDFPCTMNIAAAVFVTPRARREKMANRGSRLFTSEHRNGKSMLRAGSDRGCARAFRHRPRPQNRIAGVLGLVHEFPERCVAKYLVTARRDDVAHSRPSPYFVEARSEGTKQSSLSDSSLSFK